MTNAAEVPKQPTQAPGSNYLEADSADGGPDDAVFSAILAETVAALESHEVPYVFMGGIGSAAHGRPRWTHDIDVFVRPEDAGRALEALAEAGFRTETTFPDWLYKAFKHDVMVDVIFQSVGNILLDEEMLARADDQHFMDQRLLVMAPEDLLVIKAIVHDEHMPRHWHDGLGLIGGCSMDWDYVLKRAKRVGARRTLSLLVYAQSNDLIVPNRVISELYEAIYDD